MVVTRTTGLPIIYLYPYKSLSCERVLHCCELARVVYDAVVVDCRVDAAHACSSLCVWIY